MENLKPKKVTRYKPSIKFNAEDYGRKPVGESVPAVGWKY